MSLTRLVDRAIGRKSRTDTPDMAASFGRLVG